MAVLPGEAMPLTEPDAQWTYGMPAWSPSGDEIAFHSDEGGTEDIWLMSLDRGERVRLTRNVAVEHNPAWSPSGNMIAFQSLPITGDRATDETKRWSIWMMRSDGGDAKQLTSDESSDMNPVWSPDGSSIAFDSDRDGDSEIFLITNVQHILAGSEPELVQLTNNDWEDKYPTWSPDGSRIIFESSRRGNWDLFQIGID
jgi:Tol biopolymer transport system component